jgi:hypothetical protein
MALHPCCVSRGSPTFPQELIIIQVKAAQRVAMKDLESLLDLHYSNDRYIRLR